MAEAEFRKFYAKLSKVLPVNDILTEFYSCGLLRGDHKANIEALDTQKKKAEYFLDYVIKPGIEVGYMGQFDEMIKIMETSGDPAAKFVAGEIRGCGLSHNEAGRKLQHSNSENIGEYHPSRKDHMYSLRQLQNHTLISGHPPACKIVYEDYYYYYGRLRV